MSTSSAETERLRTLALELAGALDRGVELDVDASSVLLAALVRAYGQWVREAIDGGVHELPPVFPAGAEVTQSDAIFAAGEIIRAAGVSAFELAVWNY